MSTINDEDSPADLHVDKRPRKKKNRPVVRSKRFRSTSALNTSGIGGGVYLIYLYIIYLLTINHLIRRMIIIFSFQQIQ